ncbi:MAG: histidine--tRNA ligase [Puniceicoccales bacterium]|jgi:histidyl-tRNA synthetase|nr:histidine--tRNA ligase [Puniceicoccales bacterium]
MFTSLPGFREFYPEECAVQNYIFDKWRQLALRFGFQEWNAPVLESLELFTEKSGEEIVQQLFNFEDKGGRKVTLRPEMTPSLARLVAARANAIRRPVKWFAIGENYRYEKQQRGRLRAFYQFNADILGEASPAADAEIIALCAEALRAFGLETQDFRVRLSDRTLWFLFLESLGIPEQTAVPLLSVVDKLERLPPEDLLKAAASALAGTACDAGQVIESVRAFVAFDSLDKLEAFFASRSDTLGGKIRERLGEWRALLNILGAMGLANFLSLDLTIVRGLAYYTGFVFEVFERSGDGRALAGGGRYDALVKKLGGPDMPAVGFGMGDVTLANLLKDKGLFPVYSAAVDFYAIVLAPECRPIALADVAALRHSGMRVEYSFKDGKFGKLIQAAEQAGARHVLIYGPDEVAAGVVKIRNTQTRTEQLVPRTSLMEQLCAIKSTPT